MKYKVFLLYGDSSSDMYEAFIVPEDQCGDYEKLEKELAEKFYYLLDHEPKMCNNIQEVFDHINKEFVRSK